MAVRTRRTHLGPSVGSYGWSGFYGTVWYNDPAEEMTTCSGRMRETQAAGVARLLDLRLPGDRGLTAAPETAGPGRRSALAPRLKQPTRAATRRLALIVLCLRPARGAVDPPVERVAQEVEAEHRPGREPPPHEGAASDLLRLDGRSRRLRLPWGIVRTSSPPKERGAAAARTSTADGAPPRRWTSRWRCGRGAPRRRWRHRGRGGRRRPGSGWRRAGRGMRDRGDRRRRSAPGRCAR
jgi:hypothetical protein